MIEMLTGLPEGIDGFRPVGTVTREDCETDVVPVLDRAAAEDRRLRVVCAVVTDTGWVREASRLAAFLMPCPVRVFTGDDLAASVAWLEELPRGTGFSFRLLPDTGDRELDAALTWASASRETTPA